MKETKPLRLFVAASVPDDHQAWVEQVSALLERRWPAARWTTTENRHITLKFLGATPEDRLEAVAAACRSAAGAHRPAALRLQGLGVFPNLRRARVLWTGVEDPSGTLTEVARDLDAALEPLGYGSEARAFTPHLTLARFRDPQRIEALPPVAEAPPAFRLEALGLWRSRLSPAGARYERLADLPFGHSA